MKCFPSLRDPFVLVSQRPLRMVESLAERYGLTGLAVCSNGALVAGLATGWVIAHEPLDALAACDFVKTVRRSAPGVSFALERETFLGEEREFYAQIRRHYPGYPFEHDVVDDILTLCAEPCTALLALHLHLEPEVLADVAACVAGVSVTFSGGPFIEIAVPGATKGLALVLEQLLDNWLGSLRLARREA